MSLYLIFKKMLDNTVSRYYDVCMVQIHGTMCEKIICSFIMKI